MSEKGQPTTCKNRQSWLLVDIVRVRAKGRNFIPMKTNMTIDNVLVVLLSRLSDEILVDNDFACVRDRRKLKLLPDC